MIKLRIWAAALLATASFSITACSIDGRGDSKASGVVPEPPPTCGDTCGATVSTLLSASSQDVGTATLTNDATNLHIALQASASPAVTFDAIYIHVGLGDVPRNGDGTPDFAAFPIAQLHPSGATQAEFALPLDSILDSSDVCDRQVRVSIFVRAHETDGGASVDAWGHGPQEGGDFVYGFFFKYTVCCATPSPCEDAGCTLTQGYWKRHNEYATPRGLRRDWPGSMDEDDLICASDSRSLLTLLETPSSGGDAYLILAKQLVAAELNIENGASSTAQVDDAIADGLASIAAHCGELVPASSADGGQMTHLAGVLDAYNNGLVGPGHCGD